MVYTPLAINGHYNTSMLIKKNEYQQHFCSGFTGVTQSDLYYQSGGGLSLYHNVYTCHKKKNDYC